MEPGLGPSPASLLFVVPLGPVTAWAHVLFLASECLRCFLEALNDPDWAYDRLCRIPGILVGLVPVQGDAVGALLLLIQESTCCLVAEFSHSLSSLGSPERPNRGSGDDSAQGLPLTPALSSCLLGFPPS